MELEAEMATRYFLLFITGLAGAADGSIKGKARGYYRAKSREVQMELRGSLGWSYQSDLRERFMGDGSSPARAGAPEDAGLGHLNLPESPSLTEVLGKGEGRE